MQELHAGDEPSRNGALVLKKNPRPCVALEPGYPRLDRPYRINAAILEQWELIRICRWDDQDISTGHRSFEAIGFQPCPAGNVLRIAELWGSDFFSTKICRSLYR